MSVCAASGGGSRASYFTAAILREIHRHKVSITVPSLNVNNAPLLDQIGFVSSVSGGSLPATYYVRNSATLNGAPENSPAWTEFLDKMAVSFRNRQWYRRFATEPSLWWKFLLTNYNRGSLARDDYDQVLFDGATFADLPQKPALYVNAFDVGNNIRFVLSRHEINTGFYQSKMWLFQLMAAQDLTGANDTSYVALDPKSIRLADGVYASSAYPVAYPNLAIKHCGRNKIAFQGKYIFLADGGLADNSGLITLLTQMKASLDQETKRNLVLALNIDSTLNRIDTNGSRFQRRGVEDTYAWTNTYFRHGIDSIESSITMLHDLAWRFLQSTGVATDQIRWNWETGLDRLDRRTGTCSTSTSKASWDNAFETGVVSLRPLVIRLGLRDVLEPNFLSSFLRRRAQDPELKARLEEHDLRNDLAGFSREFSRRLLSIPTDFVLTEENRKALDLAAYILVTGKLTADLAAWSRVAEKSLGEPEPQLQCKG